MSSNSYFAIGRRKSSVCRLFMKKGTGKITINNRDIDNYFGRDTSKMVLREPLELLGMIGKFDISSNVKGGGLSGQAGAIRLAISRCLEKVNAEHRPPLKKAGMLERMINFLQNQTIILIIRIRNMN